MDYQHYLKQLLLLTIEKGASDLHFSVGHPPVFRINRKLIPLAKENPLTSEDAEKLCFCLMDEMQIKRFLEEKEIDFSYDLRVEADSESMFPRDGQCFCFPSFGFQPG